MVAAVPAQTSKLLPRPPAAPLRPWPQSAPTSVSLCLCGNPNLSALCFHTLTNCFSRLSTGRLAGKPFGFIAPEGVFPFGSSPVTSHAFSSACRLFFSLCPLLARSLCFQRFAASFAKTPGGGGGSTQFRSSAVPHLRYPLPTTHYPLSLLTPQLAWWRQVQEYRCE
jgi:hypothetical protein